MRAALATLFLAALACPAAAGGDDDFSNTAIVFVRGSSLIKSDGKGRNETEIATLPTKAQVRALRTDAAGKILLADIGGTWSYMKLDGSAKTLTELPCDPGPAQLTEDGLSVLCRAKTGGGSIIVTLATAKITPVPIPPVGARLTGIGAERKLVWADKGAVWSAPQSDLKKAKQVAKQAPARSLLPSPDGTFAAGVFQDEVYEGRTRKTGDVLMVFALDGDGARRKLYQNGVPVDWSHDGKWLLVQDGSSACVVLVVGGEYKCWRGYTASSISADGRFALIHGNRSSDKDKDKKSDKKADKKAKPDKKKKAPEPAPDEDVNPEAEGDEHGSAPLPTDDVPLPPPDGPRSLYRANLDGAFTTSPALVARVVDGAAVWIPTPTAR